MKKRTELIQQDQQELLDQLDTHEGMMSPDQLKAQIWQWYTDHYRGCTFNKVAAALAKIHEMPWLVPVEYKSVQTLSNAGVIHRVVRNIDTIVRNSDKSGLVSYMFPNVTTPADLARLIKLLVSESQHTLLLPELDHGTEFDGQKHIECVGIKFRIKVGKTESGDDSFAWPMIYNPFTFTTPARRYDPVHITFNRGNEKNNPHTPATMIGVDDIHHHLIDKGFDGLMKATLSERVRTASHHHDGHDFDRETLFRARNALVLPKEVWESAEI